MNLLSLYDLSKEEIFKIIDTAIKIKQNPQKYSESLKGKTLAMLFQKTSTRTRLSFEVAMYQLGGHAIFLDWMQTNFTLGAIKDEVKCIARYCDIIMARVYEQQDLELMAKAVKIPIINGLSDDHHPCQILSDLLTIKEKLGDFKNVKIAYIGDGNNVCNSLIIGCAKLGIKISVATPKGYEPEDDAIKLGKKSGVFELTREPKKAISGSNIVYTDTWISMGQEKEKERRIRIFKPYQLNKKLVGDSKALIMHCLPAHRGYEITDDIIDSKNSIVFDQAENRMHCQKAILLWVTGKI